MGLLRESGRILARARSVGALLEHPAPALAGISKQSGYPLNAAQSHLIVTGPARGRSAARVMMLPSQGGDIMSTPMQDPRRARSSLSIYLREIGGYAARDELVAARLAVVLRGARGSA